MDRLESQKKLNAHLEILKNALVENLYCSDKDIEIDTQYFEVDYITTITITWLDKQLELTLKGTYFPELSNFEYNGKSLSFIKQNKVIEDAKKYFDINTH